MDLKQIKNKTLDVKFTKSSFSEDDKYYHFSGYGSTFGNVDRGKDVVIEGAFSDSLKSITPKFCYQHNMKDPIGIFTEIKEDSHGLFVRGQMRKGFEKTQWIASLIEDGAIDSMSIGFNIDEGGYEYDAKTGVCLLKKLTLFEVSLVTIPMNEEARLTGFKSLDSIRDVEDMLRENGGFSAKDAKTIISKIKEFCTRDESEIEQKRDVDVQPDPTPLLEAIKNFTTIIKQTNI